MDHCSFFEKTFPLGDFYKRFKDDPIEEVKKVSFDQGVDTGGTLMRQLGIEGDDVRALEVLLRSIIGNEPTATIEVKGDSVRLANRGFCPMMATCMSLDIPWDWMCNNFGWPFFNGLGVSVNPDFDFKAVMYRYRGDPYCDHVFELRR